MKVLAQAHGADWTLYNADSVEALPALPASSVHLSVFSPPFLSLFVYSASERDLGNSRTPQQFWRHMRFVIDELLRVTVPGRLCAVHVAQVATMKATHGEIGFVDFRGLTIRTFQRRGFVYHGEFAVAKNPQAQAIRTHAKGLLLVQLRKDAAWMRPALLDFVLLFRKPGENPIPVRPDISNDDWIAWAEGVWTDIRESDTLNAAEGRDDDDERHVCPLQLPVIERCVRLWTNPGEVVLSPFAGIGSEGHEAVRLGRKFVGVELKRRYWETAVKNLRRAEARSGAADLFSLAGVEVAGG